MSKGKIIGYLPGRYPPPPATELEGAGYTHILVAFGLFSTKIPGKIVSAFPEITPNYIASLSRTKSDAVHRRSIHQYS